MVELRRKLEKPACLIVADDVPTGVFHAPVRCPENLLRLCSVVLSHVHGVRVIWPRGGRHFVCYTTRRQDCKIRTQCQRWFYRESRNRLNVYRSPATGMNPQQQLFSPRLRLALSPQGKFHARGRARRPTDDYYQQNKQVWSAATTAYIKRNAKISRLTSSSRGTGRYPSQLHRTRTRSSCSASPLHP